MYNLLQASKNTRIHVSSIIFNRIRWGWFIFSWWYIMSQWWKSKLLLSQTPMYSWRPKSISTYPWQYSGTRCICISGIPKYRYEKNILTFNPVVHFKILYITSDLGPFLSPYITFEGNIRALWSQYITFESNIQALWSPYITSKIYTGSKLDPACAK